MPAQVRKISFLALLLSLLAACLLAPAVSAADAADTDTGLPIRTAEEVAAMWRTHMVPQADYKNPFEEAPSVKAPYQIGKLRSDYLEDGLRALNFFRYISGLPDDITLDDQLNELAAHGAVLLAASNDFAHEPVQPPDMPTSFYEKGLGSTTSSNLYFSYGYDEHILLASIKAYMEDSDTNNLRVLGHRRWILNPALKKTGMGLAESPAESGGFNSYAVLQIFDKSRQEKVNYRYIPYPARGAFPVELMQARTAWSVILNPNIYANPELSRVRVTLTRERDNRTWTFGGQRYPVTQTARYFNVNTDLYGDGPAIIFRPENVEEYLPGDVFKVRITGLKSAGGQDETISYTVQFVSASAAPSPVPRTPDVPDPGPVQFSDIGRHWAEETIRWAAGAGIVSGYGDGTFRPNQTVTEAEFLVMFTRAFGARITPSSGHWSDAYYDFARQHRLTLRGLTNAAYRSQAINRTAVAELFASAAGKTLKGDDAIRFMLDNGYSKGRTEGKTAPTVADYVGSASLTRAEAVQFIRNALNEGYKAAFSGK